MRIMPHHYFLTESPLPTAFRNPGLGRMRRQNPIYTSRRRLTQKNLIRRLLPRLILPRPKVLLVKQHLNRHLTSLKSLRQQLHKPRQPTIPQKKPHLPSYKAPPRIQMIDIPGKSDDFSGISVKQRLSQSALTPTTPQASTKPPLPSRKDSALSKLSFKRTLAAPSAPTNQYTTTSSKPSIAIPKDNHASIQSSISHSPRATFSA